MAKKSDYDFHQDGDDDEYGVGGPLKKPLPRTVQQVSIISTVIAGAKNGGGKNFCVRARAGTGKSTSMLELVDDYAAAFPKHEITLCAFGAKPSAELGEKLKERGHTDWKLVQASTVHSMGFGLVKFAFRLTKDNINDNKVRDIVRKQNAQVFAEFEGVICQLVGFAKVEGFGFFNDAQIGDIGAWYKMADHYGINGFDDTSDMDRVIEAAQFIYRASLADTRQVDFDDMVLFPLVKNMKVKFQRDLLIVDEAQDTGRARQALVRKFVKPTGIMVVVGDDRQGIFGFAGAQSDALDQLINGLHMDVLPLTICWRCPKAVIKLAQQYVPDIECPDDAPEGEVLTLAELPDLEPTDAILCRNTAPLIETAYQLLRKGVACRVEGREIGTGLLRVVNRWKRVSTIAAFLERLDDWSEREKQKALAKGQDNKVGEIEDRRLTLHHLCNVCIDRQQTSLDDLRAFIESMFTDDVKAKGMVTLCTYHRSKGREWQRVFLIQHASRCPSPWAKQEWQKHQESNLAYVAITRAQHTLAFVN